MKYFYLLFFGLFFLLNGGVSAQTFRFSPPENFVQDSSQLPNYLWTNKNAGSVIQIAVSEGTSFPSFYASFQDSLLTNQNLIIKEKREIQIADSENKTQPALLILCSFVTTSDDVSKNIEFTRAICFLGNDNLMLMAVATIPAMAETVLLEPILSSFEHQLILLK